MDPTWRRMSHYEQVCLITQCYHKCDSSSADAFDFVESATTSWLRHHEISIHMKRSLTVQRKVVYFVIVTYMY